MCAVCQVLQRIQLPKDGKPAGSFGPTTPFPSENSLQFFVRTRAVLTPHDVDFVFVDEFKRTYHEFCASMVGMGV